MADDMKTVSDVTTETEKLVGQNALLPETNGGGIGARELQAVRDFLLRKKESKDSGDPGHKVLQDLISFMEAVVSRDYAAADDAVEQMVRSSEAGLYKEVGKTTRRLHDSLRSFKDAIDPKLTSIVVNDMPSAVDRIQFCVQKTEEAANKTMEIVERHMMSMRTLEDNIQKLQGPDDAVEYLNEYKIRYENDLTEIITTQSFQDITGQTLQKVILLVGDIEKELVGMVTAFGVKFDVSDNKQEIQETVDQSDQSVNQSVNQSDVDELLKEFGF